MDHYYAMIMAGGGGTRLWPLSRQAKPKQLLPLVEDRSMFAISVDRLAPLFPPENIYVVTGWRYIEALRGDAPQIPARNFIIEPEARDSGPAAALGIAVIQQRDPDAVIAILTADHHIEDKAKFRDVLEAASNIAREQDTIVTLGIAPDHPSTAFGYIQRGENGSQSNGFTHYPSLGFKEKPDELTAMKFLRSGRYSWNSGMFIWTAERAFKEFERQQPKMHELLMKLRPSVDTPEFTVMLADVWTQFEKISLDYAVMEGAEHMAVMPVDVGWSDIGSWSALFDVVDTDQFGNIYKGEAPDYIVLDTKNTLIYSDRVVATIGIDNIVVVDTQDALLVCHKDNVQDVKAVVTYLKNNNQYDYL